MEFQFKENYKFDDLVEILRILRQPGGCPWDAEQTHESIRRNFIEETYEVVEAIDNNDSELLCEELGDSMLQVVFHAQIAQDNGNFNIDDVCDGICKKLIIRHPHVFGDVVAETSEEVLTNWDAIKMQTKSQTTQAEALDSVSHALPALIRSHKVQHKAAKCGFDWPNVSGALDKLSEEVQELREAIASGDDKACFDELGDVLFSAVNVSRFIGVEPEQSLSSSCNKFIARFAEVEKLAVSRGLDMKTASLEELDAIWDEIKNK